MPSITDNEITYLKSQLGIGNSVSVSINDLRTMFYSGLSSKNSSSISGDAIQRIAVPSYFWVSWYDAQGGNHYWERMQASAPYVDISICNPSSGPGVSPNPDWVIQITRAHAAGLKVLGYVRTNYTAFTPQVVKDQINQYYSWYGVDGIFLDEASYQAANVSYYVDLYSYVKGKGGLVIINPGIPGIDEGYMTACDIVMNYEGYAANYAAATFPAWTVNYPSFRFWHAIHDVTNVAQRDTLLPITKTNRAGHIYLTTDTFASNAYDSIPLDPFWSGLVSYVH